MSALCISKLPDPLPGTNASYLRCQKEDQHCAGSNNNAMFVYGLQDGKLTREALAFLKSKTN